MSTQTFRAPWSRLLILTSTFSTVIIGAAAFGAFVIAPETRESYRWIILGLVLLLLPIALLFVVRGYSIIDGKLQIHRFGWNTVIDLAGLKSAELNPLATKRSVRTFGNGGMFSITGWYYNKTLGAYRMFATDLQRTVVLRLANRTIVVTPDNPEEFVRQVKEAASQAK
jgi:hypothetical protein